MTTNKREMPASAEASPALKRQRLSDESHSEDFLDDLHLDEFAGHDESLELADSNKQILQKREAFIARCRGIGQISSSPKMRATSSEESSSKDMQQQQKRQQQQMVAERVKEISSELTNRLQEDPAEGLIEACLMLATATDWGKDAKVELTSKEGMHLLYLVFFASVDKMINGTGFEANFEKVLIVVRLLKRMPITVEQLHGDGKALKGPLTMLSKFLRKLAEQPPAEDPDLKAAHEQLQGEFDMVLGKWKDHNRKGTEDSEMRESVEKMFFNALMLNDPSEKHAKAVAQEIEQAIFVAHREKKENSFSAAQPRASSSSASGPGQSPRPQPPSFKCGKKYKEQSLMLKRSLANADNHGLREELLRSEIDLAEYAVMTSEQVAPPKVRAEREKANAEALRKVVAPTWELAGDGDYISAMAPAAMVMRTPDVLLEVERTPFSQELFGTPFAGIPTPLNIHEEEQAFSTKDLLLKLKTQL